MKKHAILKKDVSNQWFLNIGQDLCLLDPVGKSFINALDNVSKIGWDIVSVFEDRNAGDFQAVVSMDIIEYNKTYDNI